MRKGMSVILLLTCNVFFFFCYCVCKNNIYGKKRGLKVIYSSASCDNICRLPLGYHTKRHFFTLKKAADTEKGEQAYQAIGHGGEAFSISYLGVQLHYLCRKGKHVRVGNTASFRPYFHVKIETDSVDKLQPPKSTIRPGWESRGIKTGDNKHYKKFRNRLC